MRSRIFPGVKAIGVEEIPWQGGHRYVTLGYQIDSHCKRLLWRGEKCTVKTVLPFFRWVGTARSQAQGFVGSDMWKPCVIVIAKKAGYALHILARFHLMVHLSKAIDEVRSQEKKELKAKGDDPLLTKTRGLLLKRPENLTDTQGSKQSELLQYNLTSIRSYLLKEAFQLFWADVSPYWAGRFLDNWGTKTMRSMLTPMKQVARMLRRH